MVCVSCDAGRPAGVYSLALARCGVTYKVGIKMKGWIKQNRISKTAQLSTNLIPLLERKLARCETNLQMLSQIYKQWSTFTTARNYTTVSEREFTNSQK